MATAHNNVVPVNRFFNIPGDVSRQLAPWELEKRGYPLTVARFELLERILFRSDIAGGVIEIAPRFISDLASIPRFLWPAMAPDDPRIALGAWVHDWLYFHRGVVIVWTKPTWTVEDGVLQAWPTSKRIERALSRSDCDRILAFECMPELKAARWRQDCVYAGVRIGGRSRWNHADKHFTKGE